MTKNTDNRKYRPQRRAPTPALPATYGDFLDDADQDARARQALLLGAPLDMFDWTSVVTDEVRQHNLNALTRWEAELENTRETRRKNLIDGEPSANRKRHVALRCLENAQRKLSETPEGRRDDATRDAIYELGKFVNEDYLSAAEVGQAIGDAAKVNGLADDRANGALAKVRKDVGRGLAKAKRDGLTVDWTRFDWLYTAADSDESGDSSVEIPYDPAARRLFGVPVVVSVAQATGVGHTVAAGAVALDTGSEGAGVHGLRTMSMTSARTWFGHAAKAGTPQAFTRR